MLGTSPIGGAPIGSIGGSSATPVPDEIVTDGIHIEAALFGAAATPLRDGLLLAGNSTSGLVSMLLERIQLGGSALPSADFFNVLTDGVRYNEAMQLGWMLAVQEGVNLSASAAGQRHVLAAIADTLHAVGAVNVTFDARTILTSVIALDNLLASGWRADAADSIEMQDALQGQLTAVAKLVDAAVLSDMASPSMRLVAVCDDGVSLGAGVFPSSEVFERLAEEVVFYGVIRLGDAEYVGWTLNNGGSTEYRNYPFNGMIEFNGRWYGTSSTGLYELDGADDDGQPIEWSVKTAAMDFLTGKLKRVPDCYIAFAGGGSQVVLRVITEENGEQIESIYTADVPPGSAMHNGRIKIGRGISARYWQFELSGSGRIEIDEMAWRPLVLDRRLY